MMMRTFHQVRQLKVWDSIMPEARLFRKMLRRVKMLLGNHLVSRIRVRK